jgi:hypothetical protein
MLNFWLTSQRFSLYKNKHDDVGYFEQVDWKVLALMNTNKFDKYLQLMMIILTNSYYSNRLYILKQFSCEWNDEAAIANLNECPKTYLEIFNKFGDAIFFTSDTGNRNAVQLGESIVTNADREHISTSGKNFCIYYPTLCE